MNLHRRSIAYLTPIALFSFVSVHCGDGNPTSSTSASVASSSSGSGGEAGTGGKAGAGGTSSSNSTSSAGGNNTGGAGGGNVGGAGGGNVGGAGGGGGGNVCASAPMYLDPTFGDCGIANIGFVANNWDDTRVITTQTDGKVVIAATTQSVAGSSFPIVADVVLVRMELNGAVDTTFGVGGKVLASIGLAAEPAAIHVQSDQKLLVVGTYDDAAAKALVFVARYNPDGTIDANFGQNGIATVSGLVASNPSIAFASDGKIIIRGKNATDQNILIRLLPDGTLDTTFGTGGVQTAIPATSSPIAVRQDGKIYLGFIIGSGSTVDSRITRLLADGTVDMTYGVAGEAAAALGTDADFPATLAIRKDGSLLVGGAAKVPGNVYNDSAMLALDANGALDTTFGGGDGLVHVDGLTNSAFYDIEFDALDRLVIRGLRNNFSLGRVLRFLPDGTLDTTFGAAGIVDTSYASVAGPVLGPNGEITLAGSTFDLPNDKSDIIATRVTTSGTIDPTFGKNGIASFNSMATKDAAQEMLVEPDGKIVAAGIVSKKSLDEAWMTRTLPNGAVDTSFGDAGWVRLQEDFFVNGLARTSDGQLMVQVSQKLSRYDALGKLDTTFAMGGTLDLSIGGNMWAIAVDAMDRTLVVGSGSSCSFRLVRVTKGGAKDPTLGGDGDIQTTFPTGTNCRAMAIAVQPDGKMVVAGERGAVAGPAVIRYTSSGMLDTTFGQAGIAAAATATEPYDLDNMALLPDGKILVGGYQVGAPNVATSAWVVVRLNANGQIDTTFGNAGVLKMQAGAVAEGWPQAEGPAFAVLPDGSVMAAGSAFAPQNEKMLAWKIGTNGAIDMTFGDMGKVTVPSSPGTFSAYGIGIQPDGKIVLGGRGFSPLTGTDFVFLRLAQ